MAVTIAPAKMEHIAEMGRICFEAFCDIADKHGFPHDFPSLDFARMVVGSMVSREDRYSVVALLDGQPAGSNFLLTSDKVSGVGPISVDVSRQGHGIGRTLMEDAIKYSRDNGFEMVRLHQDAFNMTSLSLYASVGFETKHPCAVMEPAPAETADPSIRPVTPADLDAVEELSQRFYKVSRRNEVAQGLGGPFPAVLRERGGRVTGYLMAGFLGHGVAETEEDMVALAAQAARPLPPEMRRVFCPLREASLYRRFLAAGFRNVKVMNLMTLGPYEEPEGVWVPSVLY